MSRFLASPEQLKGLAFVGLHLECWPELVMWHLGLGDWALQPPRPHSTDCLVLGWLLSCPFTALLGP